MAQTLQNQLLIAKSMNGIIALTDGAGSTISNGQIITNDLSGNNISSNSFNTNTFILPRNSTPAVNAILGSTINVEEVLENVYFGHIDRLFAIANDFGGNMVLFNTASNLLEMQPDILNIYPDTQLIISTTTNFSNGSCNFINCPIVASNNTTLTIPRISTAAVKTLLGNSIELSALLQNMYFNTGPRIFEFYSDSAAVMIDLDVLNNNMNIRTGTTFNTLIPTTTLTPTLNTHFTTLGYSNGLYGRLASANAWTSTNTFNTSLPTSTLTPTTATQLVTKTYVDSTFGHLAFANAWTNTNTFNSFLPTSTLTPTTGTQLITKTYGDATYGRLATANTWALQNTFTTGILPRTALTATNIQIGGNNQMANRQAASLNCIGIGANTVAGDQNAAGFVYNVGSNLIGIGANALQTADAAQDCIAIGVNALQNAGGQRLYGVGIIPNRCIAIGKNSQQTNFYGNDNITIGDNCFPTNIGGQGNVLIGSNVGVALSDRNGCTIVGTGACPSAQDNQITAFGYRALGAATGTANSISVFGAFAGYNNTNGTANQYFGALAGYDCTTGSDSCFFGYAAGTGSSAGESCVYMGRATNTTFSNPFNSIAIGFNAQIQEDYEFVIGGAYSGTYPRLTIPNKTRLACNQSLTGATINLAFRTNENVLLTDSTTTSINLPTPATANIGCKYFIQRAVSGGVNITINAPSGQLVAYLKNEGSYTTASSYTFAKTVANIRLLCIDSTVSGANWIIMNTLNAEASDSVLVTTPVSVPATKYSIPFGGLATGYTTLYMDNTNISYQASTSTLFVANLQQASQYLHSSSTQLTGTANLSIATAPYYENYNIAVTGPITLTIPTASASLAGVSLVFRRTNTSAVAITCSPAYYALTSNAATTTALLTASATTSAGNYIKLVCLLTSGTTYAWYQV